MPVCKSAVRRVDAGHSLLPACAVQGIDLAESYLGRRLASGVHREAQQGDRNVCVFLCNTVIALLLKLLMAHAKITGLNLHPFL